jgi:glycosyltransferase involved in cell wall biosynthesis
MNNENKVKVLLITNSLDFGGGQRTIQSIARHIDKKYFQPIVCGLKWGGNLGELFEKEGFKLLLADKSAEKVIDFVRKEGVEVLYLHRSGEPEPLYSQLLSSCSDVAVVENNVFAKYDPQGEKYIDCHVFQSKMMLTQRYWKFVKDKDKFFSQYKVIYNPVDCRNFEKYRVNEDEIKSFKRSLKISEDDFVIGRIGRKDLEKWSDILIEMMPYLIRIVPQTVFLVQGIPERKWKLIKTKNLESYFRVLEPTPNEKEVALFYQSIDVLAHSSKIGEAMGNTISEAQYWRRPVVVNSTPSRDNGQVEQVDHGKDGFVANYPQTFARALAFLHHHPKTNEKFGEMGHQKVLSKCEAKKIVGQYEKVFVEACRKKKITMPLGLKEKVSKVDYKPSEQEILHYFSEYYVRSKQDFGSLSFVESIQNSISTPYRFYQRFVDNWEQRKRRFFRIKR